MIVQTFHGVTTTPNVLVWSAETLGYSRRQMLGPIFLRHALPDIMTGLRIALGFSFVLAISSEMIAANSGIGKLIFMYGENGAYDYMFAAIACVVAVAFAADRLARDRHARCLRWHEFGRASWEPADDAARRPRQASTRARSPLGRLVGHRGVGGGCAPASCPAVLPAGVQRGDGSALEHHRRRHAVRGPRPQPIPLVLRPCPGDARRHSCSASRWRVSAPSTGCSIRSSRWAFPSPKIAFLPVFILWFGIDSLSKILLVAFACVFPIIIAHL